MIFGSNGLDLLKSFETCQLVAYLDTGYVPTIGWGHTLGVKLGDTCTQEQADKWLADDTEHAASCVTHKVTVPLSQNQFDALTSFAYNVGTGAFTRSTLLRLLNQRKYDYVGSELMKWVKDNGVIIGGLVRRRRAEKALFESATP